MKKFKNTIFSWQFLFFWILHFGSHFRILKLCSQPKKIFSGALLLGDSPETVRYDKELGHHGNSDVFRLLRTI